MHPGLQISRYHRCVVHRNRLLDDPDWRRNVCYSGSRGSSSITTSGPALPCPLQHGWLSRSRREHGRRAELAKAIGPRVISAGPVRGCALWDMGHIRQVGATPTGCNWVLMVEGDHSEPKVFQKVRKILQRFRSARNFGSRAPRYCDDVLAAPSLRCIHYFASQNRTGPNPVVPIKEPDAFWQVPHGKWRLLPINVERRDWNVCPIPVSMGRILYSRLAGERACPT